MRALLLAASFVAVPMAAQAADASLVVELNALAPSEDGCRVTFLATNNLGTELQKSALEIALFGAGGAIDRLVSLNFDAMPVGKTKVLQFDLEGLDCGALTRVLVNDVVACQGEGLEPRACLASLVTRSNTEVAFGV